ncbi:MAG: tRNA (guanosine(46)-N7)-methyltransferase TrmB, partial [Gammaproteobacteria bacterium]|nr:tRNA (guanosine(46)-N7)-methyltransferase TrmB [Gammaproteobacteria bacterium]
MRREGRLTEGQRRGLEEQWPTCGVEPSSEMLDLDQVYGRSAPRILEIGFGMGESLAAMASAHPENDYLGIEVYRPGVGSLLRQVGENGSTNVRVISEDAVIVLAKMIPDNSLDRLQLFFPDPWHKKRHHKRRIVQPDFVALICKKLKPGGVFHMATDWQAYA